MSEVIYTIEDLKQSPLVQQEHVTLKMYKKKNHTCRHHTLPQSCACIHWNLPSHSRENAGRSVRGGREEGKTTKRRKRKRSDQARKIKGHSKIWR